MAGPAPSIPVGRIAGYEVQGKLGAGGMGVVYKALDLKLNRTVALKFLSEEEVTAEDRERLLREARAASALDHPNIAAVHTVEETADGRAFIVMGYYEGETLADKIRHSPLQPAHAVNVAMQIAGGLQHAHTRNITHRDIKSANVLITNDGIAKILDFGLARVHGPSASTESASLSGTLLYMSPEQVQGRPLDARTDIWALGVVLYQMLTGRVPFFTDNAASTILAILNAPPAPMPGVPDELQLIILRALSKTPESRYQNCTELIRDLEKLAVDDKQPTVTVERSELQRQLRSASQSASGLPIASPRRILWLTVALCIAIGVCLAVAIAFTPLRWRIFGPQEKHIVVLPFDVESQDSGAQSLADGLAESIAGKLAMLDSKQSLWVVPGSEVRRRNVRDVDAARKEFGATLAVKGTVQRIGDGVHITVDLIDTHSLRLLGSASLERSGATLSSIDDDAVSSLSKFMSLEARPSLPLEKTAGAAYEAYLKGRGYLQHFDKPGNLEEAIKQFESVIAADPKFTLGYAALAEAYFDHYGLDSNAQWVQKASDYCKQAMGLSDKLPAVFVTCGRVHDGSGLYELALSEFQRAMTLDPRSSDARVGIASVYEHLKREREAEESLKEAAAMRPDYWYFTYQLGAFYTRQRRYPEAEREFRKVLTFSPDSAYAHSNLGSIIQVQGADRYPAAETELRRSLELGPTYPAFNNLGTMYYRQKRWADAAEMLRKALEINSHDYRVWANLGISYEWLDQPAKADAAYREELPLLETAAKLKPNDSQIQVELAIRYAKLKLRDKALAQVEAALARSPDDPRVLSNAAEAYDDLGDRTRALALASKSLAKGGKPEQLELNPGLRGVLADPRFQAGPTRK
jgi:serine/threonine-protein kinase